MTDHDAPRSRRQHTLPAELVRQAVHTVLAEVPADTHEDDILDAVYGLQHAAFDQYGEESVRNMVRSLR